MKELKKQLKENHIYSCYLYYGTEYGVKYLPVRRGTTVLVHIFDEPAGEP